MKEQQDIFVLSDADMLRIAEGALVRLKMDMWRMEPKDVRGVSLCIEDILLRCRKVFCHDPEVKKRIEQYHLEVIEIISHANRLLLQA